MGASLQGAEIPLQGAAAAVPLQGAPQPQTVCHKQQAT